MLLLGLQSRQCCLYSSPLGIELVHFWISLLGMLALRIHGCGFGWLSGDGGLLVGAR